MYRDYNKEELFERIDKLSIERTNNQVITKYNGVVTNISNVSNRYEIFDLPKYLKEKIDLIEKNFNISKYEFIITKGRQYLTLVSDEVTINDIIFQKTFYIQNSTDRSRKLSFYVGLQSKKFSLIRSNNIELNRKHLTGITQIAESATEGLNVESFDEQIESMKSLVGHTVKFSNIRKVILGNDEKIPKINHQKFDMFKNLIKNSLYDTLTPLQRRELSKYSEHFTLTEDFVVDAFLVLNCYLSIFRNQDSHIIKTESERIFKITQYAIRNSRLETLELDFNG